MLLISSIKGAYAIIEKDMLLALETIEINKYDKKSQ